MTVTDLMLSSTLNADFNLAMVDSRDLKHLWTCEKY